MGLLEKLFGGGAGNLVKEVGEVLDKFITTKAEKDQAQLEVKKVLLEYEARIQQELSRRHAADMRSDSWLSKNIRPLVLISCFILVTLFAVADGNLGAFEVQDAYKDMIDSTLQAAVAFYFIGRTGEKGWKWYQERLEKKEQNKDNKIDRHEQEQTT